MKFLLKKRYDLLSNDDFLGEISYYISFAFMISLKTFFKISFFENLIFEVLILLFILFLGFITNLTVFLLIKITIDEYRLKNPTAINYINQNGKTLEERHYPSLCRKEYYYNGSLHNEKNGAIQYDNDESECFYLFGKKYNLFDFIEQKNKIIMQEKMGKF